MALGGSSLTLAADTLPSNTRSEPLMVAFDGTSKWCAINFVCQSWYIDSAVDGSVINPANWNASAGYALGSGSDQLYNLFYDKGSDGTNGVGFVAITVSGSGSATVCKVYTSTDGDTFTLQKTFSDASGAYHAQLAGAAGKYPLSPSQRT
jgi:hypothetical protein